MLCSDTLAVCLKTGRRTEEGTGCLCCASCLLSVCRHVSLLPSLPLYLLHIFISSRRLPPSRTRIRWQLTWWRGGGGGAAFALAGVWAAAWRLTFWRTDERFGILFYGLGDGCDTVITRYCSGDGGRGWVGFGMGGWTRHFCHHHFLSYPVAPATIHSASHHIPAV